MILKTKPIFLATLNKIKHFLKRSKLVTVLLFVFIPLGLAIAYKAPSTEVRSGRLHQVELRSDGFHPAELTIKKGDSVNFTTTRGNFFWPASDIHPSHALYPNFDPKNPVDPTKSWAFKFELGGIWKFHDHLSPSFRGVISVQDDIPQDTSSQGPKCDNETNPIPLQCRKEELLQLLRQNGVDKTFQALEDIYKANPELAGSCHGVAHDLGVASYPLYLQDKNSVFSAKAAYCASGFYHGFMEAMLGASRDVELSRLFCLQVDEKLTALAPDSYLQCFHGIGHGAIEYTLGGGVKPSSNESVLLKPALELCVKASQTDQELYRCASGAFNALANIYISGQYGLKAREEDPLWICKIQPDRYLESCYGNMNSYLLWQTKNDLKDALKFTTELEDGQAPRATWYLSSLASASNLLRFDPVKINDALSACRELNKPLMVACTQGLTQGFLEHGTPSIEYLEVLKFCGLGELTPEEKEICYSFSLGNLQGWYSKEKGLTICRELTPEIRKYCHPSLL